MSMNSVSLPQNKALFDSDLLAKFLLHIIVYQQYHLQEEDEFSRMAPSLAIKTGWKPSFHVRDSAASALAPPLSNPHIWATAEVHHFRPF